MWPWTHLVFGYVAYSLWRRISARTPPTDAAALCCAFGTQFPDLVDKPLAWTFGVIPSGRSLTHSVISATLILAVALWYAYWRGHRLENVTAFGIGYYSHLFGDALAPLLNGSPRRVSFLLWPVLPPVEYLDVGFIAHFARLEPSQLSAMLLLVLPAVLLWVMDGTPGTALFGWIRNRMVSR